MSLTEAFTRMAIAAVLAAIIGIERDEKRKPIDFRAFIIIAVTSCGLCIMAQELAAEKIYEIDLGKVMEGILTGIGFLGAGAIIQKGDMVVGTATGASVWSSGGIGIALGFGYYLLALLLFLAMFATLYIGGFFSAKYFQRK